jgi:hypothetical protein
MSYESQQWSEVGHPHIIPPKAFSKDFMCLAALLKSPTDAFLHKAAHKAINCLEGVALRCD